MFKINDVVRLDNGYTGEIRGIVQLENDDEPVALVRLIVPGGFYSEDKKTYVTTMVVSLSNLRRC